MLQPVRTKFRKAFKGRIHGKAARAVKLNYGQFGLKAIEPMRSLRRRPFCVFRDRTVHLSKRDKDGRAALIGASSNVVCAGAAAHTHERAGPKDAMVAVPATAWC